jgi:hypothetical protein
MITPRWNANEKYAEGVLTYYWTHLEELFEAREASVAEGEYFYYKSLHALVRTLYPQAQPVAVVNEVLVKLGAVMQSGKRGTWIIIRKHLFTNDDGTPLMLPDKQVVNYGSASRTTQAENNIGAASATLAELRIQVGQLLEGLVDLTTMLTRSTERFERLVDLLVVGEPVTRERLEPPKSILEDPKGKWPDDFRTSDEQLADEPAKREWDHTTFAEQLQEIKGFVGMPIDPEDES